jgi:hypothetical protein
MSVPSRPSPNIAEFNNVMDQVIEEAFVLALRRLDAELGTRLFLAQVTAVPHQHMLTERGRDGDRIMHFGVEFTDTARGNASALLRQLLSDEQWKAYEDTGYFDVEAKGQTYRLGVGTKVGVWDEAHERIIEDWCSYVPHEPHEDTIVAQLLELQHDPQALRERAVVTKYPLKMNGYFEYALRQNAERVRRYAFNAGGHCCPVNKRIDSIG